MKGRNIKPGICHDGRMLGLPDSTVLFYIFLWMVADDDGRFSADFDDLAGQTGRWNAEQVESMLDELSGAGRVYIYGEGRYGYIKTFYRHQYRCRPVKSHFPPPPEFADALPVKLKRAKVNPAEDGIPYEAVIKAWNDMAEKKGLSTVAYSLADDRLTILREQWKKEDQGHIGFWQTYFHRIGISPFLTGKFPNHPFRATFAWSLLEQNIVSTMTGVFDGPAPKVVKKPSIAERIAAAKKKEG